MSDVDIRRTGPPRVTGLHHLGITGPDLDALVDFYVDRWGLRLVDREPGGPARLATTMAAQPDVLLYEGPEGDLHHIAFGVASGEDLQLILGELRAAGVTPQEEDDERAVLLDPDANVVELVVVPTPQAEDMPPPADEDAADDRVRPRKLGHVVLHTGQPEEMEAFYGLLGFRVTDRTSVGMSFLRCNADHHTLALVATGDHGLQHVAYDVGTLDDVMRGLSLLRSAEVAPMWGPGRHGPGNNVFTYYQDPAGNIIEYYGDLEIFDVFEPDAAPRVWGPEHKGDRWGIAGPPPPAFIRRQAGGAAETTAGPPGT